jgi:hypothetical protein
MGKLLLLGLAYAFPHALVFAIIVFCCEPWNQLFLTGVYVVVATTGFTVHLFRRTRR